MSNQYGAASPVSPEAAANMSRAVFDGLMSDNPAYVKEANETITGYTRLKMREAGFLRKLLPQTPVTNSDLDRSMDPGTLQIIVDMEPDSPGAITVGFGSQPDTLIIRGSRYRVVFRRIQTVKFTQDVDLLRTYIMDIRSILSDNSIKDMLAEEDGKAINAVNRALIGPGVVSPLSGSVQHAQIRGGISRDTWFDSLNIMPANSSNLEVHTILMNHLTVKELAKMDFVEFGGDTAQNIMLKGWTLDELSGKRLLVTIKKNIVTNNSFYHFCSPEFLGKHFSLEDTTMYVKRDGSMIEFYATQLSGLAFGNWNGLARADFI